ncbi:MAG: hypothetical protein U0L05_02105 [Schaedlerella sp.]|nr:hypothetical protein [Schaedlerella sp.]
MRQKKRKNIAIIDVFDDDFEITYEDDFEDVYEDEYDTEYENDYEDEYDEEEDDYEDEDVYEDENDEYESHHTSRKKRKRRKLTPVAAPIKKSSKAVYKLVNALLRNLSLLLILTIIGYMALDFYKGSAPYGDIMAELQAQNFSQILVSYYGVAACLIFFELISALWAMSKARVRDEHGRHREDVGRGLFSFIFIYVCSHAAFLLSGYIPDIPEYTNILAGIRGVLTVFGSMHNVLFGLCTAGVISCLLRKYHL